MDAWDSCGLSAGETKPRELSSSAMHTALSSSVIIYCGAWGGQFWGVFWPFLSKGFLSLSTGSCSMHTEALFNVDFGGKGKAVPVSVGDESSCLMELAEEVGSNCHFCAKPCVLPVLSLAGRTGDA